MLPPLLTFVGVGGCLEELKGWRWGTVSPREEEPRRNTSETQIFMIRLGNFQKGQLKILNTG